jgi:GNAT superfamily N-acetyltransferase
MSDMNDAERQDRVYDTTGDLTIRDRIRPGDAGAIIAMHGLVYGREAGFDVTFEAYVAGPLAAFVLRGSARERLWIAERGDALAGSIAIVTDTEHVAQLRWFLVAPDARGAGLGARLLAEALAFSRAAGYDRVVLWTVSSLRTAARLYTAAGFTRVEAVPGRRWGVDVTEEKYELNLHRIP